MATPQRVNAEENGFVWNGTSWVAPTPAPAPVAVFSAASPSATLGTNGMVAFDSNNKTSEEIPNSSGQRGFPFPYNSNGGDFDRSPNNDLYLSLLIHQSEMYEYGRIWQPANYVNDAVWAADAAVAPSTFSDWVDGDTITTNGGNTARFRSFKDLGGGNTRLFFDLNSQSLDVAFQFPTGGTVTNDNTGRTTRTFTITNQDNTRNNKKFSSFWCDNGGPSRGYENGAFTVSTYGDPTLGGYNPNARWTATPAGDEFQLGIGDVPNQLASPPYDPLIVFDTANNGTPVEYVIRRRRATTESSSDGAYQFWMKSVITNNVWQLVYENLNLDLYTDFSNNQFTDGYLFGAANGGFLEATTFYLMDWQLWLQKPTFLP